MKKTIHHCDRCEEQILITAANYVLSGDCERGQFKVLLRFNRVGPSQKQELLHEVCGKCFAKIKHWAKLSPLIQQVQNIKQCDNLEQRKFGY